MGEGVPERYYRAGIDRDEDGPLDALGVMRLHLGGQNSDVLVFLIQYADQVVVLETNTHIHFRTQPAGANLLALNQSWLGTMERGMAEAATQAQAAATAAERLDAQERAAKQAAAIAAFKLKAGLR